MRSTYSQKRRLKNCLPISAQHTYICERNKILVHIKLIDNPLIPADMNTAAQHMHRRLNCGINRDLRDNVGEDLSFVIIIKTHNYLSLGAIYVYADTHLQQVFQQPVSGG